MQLSLLSTETTSSAADAGSAPGAAKDFFSQGQLSVQTLTGFMRYSIHVQRHALTTVYVLKHLFGHVKIQYLPG